MASVVAWFHIILLLSSSMHEVEDPAIMLGPPRSISIFILPVCFLLFLFWLWMLLFFP